MSFCMACGTKIRKNARKCPACAQPVDEEPSPLIVDTPPAPEIEDVPAVEAPAPRRAAPPVAHATPSSESAGELTARIVGIFGVIGLGLGIGTLLFLWATGFFDASDAESLNDLGDFALGAVTLGVVSAFAVLIGVVIAAVGGVLAANRTSDRATAMRVAAVGAAGGHFALIIVLGGLSIAALVVRSAIADEPDAAASSREERIAECEQIFGAGEPFCQEQSLEVVEEEPEASDDVSVDDVARLGLGIIPATVVGALSAAVAFSPRRP